MRNEPVSMRAPRYSHHPINRTVLNSIWGIIGVLILANIIFIFFTPDLESLNLYRAFVVRQFDINAEGNFATWFSSMLLLLNSLCAYELAHAHWSTQRRLAVIIAIMSVGFLLLSIDDVIRFHESAESATASLLSGTDGMDKPTLKRYLGPLLAISLAIIFTFVFVVPYLRIVQRENIPLLVACIVCLFLVALSEYIYDLSGCAELWCFRLEVTIEEGCEFFALVLFVTFQSRELLSLRENNTIEVTG